MTLSLQLFLRSTLLHPSIYSLLFNLPIHLFSRTKTDIPRKTSLFSFPQQDTSSKDDAPRSDFSMGISRWTKKGRTKYSTPGKLDNEMSPFRRYVSEIRASHFQELLNVLEPSIWIVTVK